jgi:predicted RNA binding protein YcfA (HicA-like mRNA interferase family)
MTDFTREIRARLRDAGWQFHRRAKGDHEIWINPATGQKVTVDGKVRNRALANKILRDAELGKAF